MFGSGWLHQSEYSFQRQDTLLLEYYRDKILVQYPNPKVPDEKLSQQQLLEVIPKEQIRLRKLIKKITECNKLHLGPRSVDNNSRRSSCTNVGGQGVGGTNKNGKDQNVSDPISHSSTSSILSSSSGSGSGNGQQQQDGSGGGGPGTKQDESYTSGSRVLKAKLFLKTRNRLNISFLLFFFKQLWNTIKRIICIRHHYYKPPSDENWISTCQYSPISWLPLSIMQQLRRRANIYILFVCILTLTE